MRKRGINKIIATALCSISACVAGVGICLHNNFSYQDVSAANVTAVAPAQSQYNINAMSLTEETLYDLYLPEHFTYDGDTITGISEAGQAIIDTLDSYTIYVPDANADGVATTTLGESIFENDQKLTNIRLPNGLSTIKKNAFREAKLLESIELPASLTTVEINAFGNNTNLTKMNYLGTLEQWCAIDLVSTPTAITKMLTIQGVDIVGEVTIPEGVTRLESGTFDYCEGITNVIFPESLEYIGDYAFANCTGLPADFTIPSQVKEIGEYAFQYTNIENLTLEGVEKIGNLTFLGCTSLVSIVLPSTLTEITNFAFSGCTNLTNMNYLGTLEQWCNINFNYSVANPTYYTKKLIIQGEEVKGHIDITQDFANGQFTFVNCEDIDSVAFGDNVTRVNSGIFEGTGITQIILPESVNYIGGAAFKNCSNLVSVAINFDDYIGLGFDTFDGCENLENIIFKNSTVYNKILNLDVFSEYTNDITYEVKLNYIEKGSTTTITKLYNRALTWTKANDGTWDNLTTVSPLPSSGTNTSWRLADGTEATESAILSMLSDSELEDEIDITLVTDMNSSTVGVLFADNVEYNGQTNVPTTYLTDLATNEPLVYGVDYEMVLSDTTDYVNVGSKSFVIRGKGHYSGELSFNYFITPFELVYTVDRDSCTGTTTITYGDGAPTLESIVFVNMGGYVIELPADGIAITYRGTPTVGGDYAYVLTGSGNYMGSTTIPITVNPKDINNVSVDDIPDYDYTGSAITPEPIVKDTINGETKTLINGTDYIVSYSNNTNAGTAYITITGQNNYTSTKQISFEILQKSFSYLDVVINTNSFTYNGQIQTPAITSIKLGDFTINSGDYTVKYFLASDLANEAEPVNAGTYKMYIYPTDTLKYTDSKSIEFTINKASLVDANIQQNKSTFTYNAMAQRPTFTVIVNGRTLVENTDFEVSFDVDPINVGTYTCTFTGIGNNYTDEKTIEDMFSITALNITGATIVLEGSEYTYAGEAITPNVTSMTIGGVTVTDFDDFTISYTDNNSATTATVTIAPQDTNKNFTGSASTTFVIGKGAISSAVLSIDSATYNAKQQKPTYTVYSSTGVVLKENTDYKVTLSNDSFDYINAGSVTYTITGLNSFTGTITKIFTIAPYDISSISLSLADSEYDREENLPNITITDSNNNVLLDSDYTVKYYTDSERETEVTDVINAGTYYVSILGQGNYIGTIETTYIIEPKSIDSLSATVEGSYVYNGSAFTPDVVMKDGDYSLVKDTDYTLTYADNTAKGEATITITGQGNYTDSKTTTFTIASASFDTATVTLGGATGLVYNGKSQKPTSITVMIDGQTLTEDVDFTVSYPTDTTNAGEKTIVITSINANYSGTQKATYFIDQKVLSSGDGYTLEGFDDTVDYTGGSITFPSLKIYDNNLSSYLVSSDSYKDYTIAYQGNQEVGTATLTITGQGNYTDSIELEFSIEPLTIDTVTLSMSNTVYNGQTHNINITVKAGDVTLDADEYTVVYQRENNGGVWQNTTDFTSAGVIRVVVKSNSTNFVDASIDGKIGEIEILPATISTVTFKNNITYATYNISSLEDQIVIGAVKTENHLTLDADDYIVSYQREGTSGWQTTADFTSAGTIRVLVQAGDNLNYKGYAYADFVIYPKSINDDDITIRYYFVDENGNQVDQYGNASATEVYYDRETAGAQVYVGQLLAPEIIFNNGTTTETLNSNDTDYTYTIESKNHQFTDFKQVDTYVMSIVAEGNYTDTYSPEFQVVAAEFTSETIDITIIETVEATGAIKDKFIYDGQAITLSAEDIAVTYTKPGAEPIDLVWGTDFSVYDYTGELTLENENGEKYTVDVVNGYAQNINAGTAMVFLQGLGENFQETYVCKHFTIYPYTVIDDENSAVNVAIQDSDNRIYNGKPWTPGLSTATSTIEPNKNFTLEAGTDYTLTYDNNVNATNETNKAIAYVTFKGNYTGSLALKFNIKAKDISSTDVSLADIENKVYSGAEQKPEIDMTYEGMSLVESTDYNVAYKDSLGNEVSEIKNAGTYTIIINGTGNYTGTREIDFTIDKKLLSGITINKSEGEYFREAHDFTITVTDVDGSVVSDDEYTLKYYNEETEIFAPFVNAMTIAIKVVPNEDGNYYLADGSELNTQYIITPKDLSDLTIELSQDSYIYSGEENKPTVTILWNGEDITDEIGYSLAYSDHVNVGEATVTISAEDNNYTGSVDIPFTITKKKITSVTLSEDSVVYDGEEHTFTVAVYDNDGGVVYASEYNINYTDEEGEPVALPVTDVIKVKVQIVPKAKGNYELADSELYTTYEITQYDISDITPILTDSYTFTGNELVLDMSILDANGNTLATDDYTVTYYTDSVRETEATNVINAGTYYLTISGQGNYTSSIDAEITITPKAISEDMIYCGDHQAYQISGDDTGHWYIADQMYTGEAITPTLTIRYNGQTYETSELNYVGNTSEGLASITYTAPANGNFSGSVNIYFYIVKVGINQDNYTDYVDVEPIADQQYTGSAICPEIKISIGGNQLEKDTDFTVSFTNNTNVGTATVSVSFDDIASSKYSGGFIFTFEIVQRTLSNDMLAIIESKPYTGSEQTADITLTLGDYTLDLDDYTVKYYTDSERNDETTNVINAGTYYLTITGEGNFAGELKSTFTISAKNLEDSMLTIKPSDVIYNGSEQKTTLSMSYDTIPMVEGVDYEVEYDQTPINARAYTLTIRGQGNFGGTITTTYIITPKTITVEMFEAVTSQVYTGTQICPTLTIKETGLTANDYTVTYGENIAAGITGTIEITGKNNYASSARITFSISQRDISDAAITVGNISATTYNGTEQKATITLTSNGVDMTGNFIVTYYTDETRQTVATEIKNAGTYYLTISGQNGLTGSRTAEYVINPVVLTDDMLTAFASPNYDGLNKNPTITLTLSNGNKLTANDYTVIYKNSSGDEVSEIKYAGDYTVIISGQNNATGAITATYTVKKANPNVAPDIDLKDWLFYAGQDISKIKFDQDLGLGEIPYGGTKSSTYATQGMMKFDSKILIPGNNTVTWTFTPQSDSFEVVTGSMTIYAYVETEVIFGGQNTLVEGVNTNLNISVKAKYNNTILSSSLYTITYKDASGAVVQDINKSGRYTVIVAMTNTMYKIGGESETHVYVKASVLTSEIKGLYVESNAGFDEGVEIKIFTITEESEIKTYLGEVFDDIQNISHITVIKLMKNGKEFIHDNYTIYITDEFDLSGGGIYCFDGELTDVSRMIKNHDKAILALNDYAILVYAEKVVNNTLWIVLGIVGGLVLLIIIILTIYLVKRKRRQMIRQATITNTLPTSKTWHK
ncbi:MAG: hypothetical protein E7351_01215 [Clostridiales bacterium]|nr:hypothetical protein [Clostridiales bacterium]